MILSWLVRGLVLILIFSSLVVGGGFFYIRSLLTATNPTQTETQIFVVEKGKGVNEISQKLYETKLTKHPYSLKLAAYLAKNSQIQAGSYRLSQSMSPDEILKTLKTGRLDVWVTFIEGWRREEFLAALTKVLDGSSTFSAADFLKLTANLEGQLSPNTYLVPINATAADVVSILTKARAKEIKDLMIRPENQNRILTIASLLEREGKTETARKMISGIINNRLKLNMPLQIDATLQYVKASNAKNPADWWITPLAEDKQLNSLYNTYQHPGLPPGPICNPSVGSIKAAISLTESEYLFYITGNDGHMYYAKTLAEHNANIAKYLK